jgi:alpha-1,2-mannosyltransferase
VLTAPGFVNLAQFDNASLQGLLARLEVVGSVPAAVLVLGCGLVALLAYRRSRRLYASGQLLAGAVVVGAMAVLVSPVSWSHHQTTLVLAGLCLVSSRSAGANRLWAAVVFALMFLPLQLVGHRWWPAADVVTDNLVVLLALLVACVLPFRTAAVGPGRGEPGDLATGRPSRPSAGTLTRRR